MSYIDLKTLHLIGVVLFLGNIIVTAFWKIAADRTGEPRIVAFAQRTVNLADILFTAPGVAIILGTAYAMAWQAGLDLAGPAWVRWGQAMFLGSGAIWVAVLIPTQIAQARLARGFANGGSIPDRYRHLNRRWLVWGLLATLLPLANLWFMVAKP